MAQRESATDLATMTECSVEAKSESDATLIRSQPAWRDRTRNSGTFLRGQGHRDSVRKDSTSQSALAMIYKHFQRNALKCENRMASLDVR